MDAGHLKEWQQSVDRLAGPLMDKATVSLTQADVLSVIKPAWDTTNETARRVLGRIEQTIEHAMAVDPRPVQRPQSLRQRLAAPPSRVREREAEGGNAMAGPPRLLLGVASARRGQRLRALEFLLLTCCPRTGEVIPAAWGEIDGDKWHVPASHMKSGQARTIPLTSAAIALLAGIRPDAVAPTRSYSGAAGEADRPPDRRCDAGAPAREDGP